MGNGNQCEAFSDYGQGFSEGVTETSEEVRSEEEGSLEDGFSEEDGCSEEDEFSEGED